MMGPGSRVDRGAIVHRAAPGWTALILLPVVLAACGGSSHAVAGVKGGSEVQAQAISTAGNNPFTASVGKDKAGVKPPAGAGSSSGGAVSYVANTPGLYGGTRDISTCDANELVNFLEQNPAKAAAWAAVLGIQTSQIRSYVDGLTPVLLRTDTRVTNHGYVNGQATALQAVLEAGTAVMVDSYGRPVVKCYCGNPLTPPVLYAAPVYTGPLWAGFSSSNVTIIQQSTTIIKQFILYDPDKGLLFPLTPGISGKAGPYQQPSGATGPTTPSTTAAPSTTPAPTPPQTTPAASPTRPAENPTVSLTPNPVTAGDTVTLSASGFAPNVTLRIDVDRPDGNTDYFSTTSDSGGNASYTFPNAGGSITGTYTVTITNPNTGANATTTIDVLPAGGQTTT